ncbi:hypothetical protein L3Y34_006432 [Caenorhabditis briggsae]|uniref:Uncharacterized protein n=1 Tax=Caenorhabditis briggsae TaxID=6238 RepID=A0AAE9CZH3_CAEBR|nr:hypothetical protein L3Y34_006432 [Caenorhabditis briggsae]
MEPPPIPPAYYSDPPEAHEDPILKFFWFGPDQRSERGPERTRRTTMSWQSAASTSRQDVLIISEPRRFSCAIVESTSITPPLPKRVVEKRRSSSTFDRLCRHLKQFFESINPRTDFKTNEDLEDYLYQKSCEIQPKGAEVPNTDLKPKHTSSTLRSPGIKPPKAANHYSANHPIGLGHLSHSQHSHSAPHAMSSGATSSGHQSSTVPSTPVTIHETKRSMSQTQASDHQKIPVLQPPPLLPRSRYQPPPPLNPLDVPPTTQAPMPPAPKSGSIMSQASSPTSSSTTPSSAPGPAPKLHPRRGVPQPMSPLAKSPLTPSRDNASPSAFQFPVVYDSAPPPLPPRPSAASSDGTSPSTSSVASKENQEQLRVIFDREESHSPTVRLSVPLPPALPPPRGSAVFRAPPPLPPKSGRHNSNSPTTPSSADPFDDPTSPSIFVNTPPPPLPPKTYRVTKKP